MFQELIPVVYKVIKKKTEGYDLVIVRDNYNVRKKLYGKILKLLYRISKLLSLRLFSNISVLMTGGKGLGKTTGMNKICNDLLAANIPIIEIKYLKIDVELVEFLSNFRNVTIFIDEFGKYFDNSIQEKMLTLLNRDDDYFNIYILGENEIYKINDFLLDRMERLKYHIHLSRIPNEDMVEYCKDNDFNKEITTSLLEINKTSSKISYDTLEMISKESKIFPELSFEDLTSVLNCQGILGVPVMNVLDIRIESDTKYVKKFEFYPGYEKVRHSNFLSGSTLYFNVTLEDIKPKEEQEVKPTPPSIPSYGYLPNMVNGNSGNLTNVRVASSDIVHMDDLDNTIECNVNSGGVVYIILLNIKVISNN